MLTGSNISKLQSDGLDVTADELQDITANLNDFLDLLAPLLEDHLKMGSPNAALIMAHAISLATSCAVSSDPQRAVTLAKAAFDVSLKESTAAMSEAVLEAAKEKAQ